MQSHFLKRGLAIAFVIATAALTFQINAAETTGKPMTKGEAVVPARHAQPFHNA